MVEQRKSKRFEIALPLRVVRNGVKAIAGAGHTRNLSSSGVLFASDTKIEVGEPIEYVITLSADSDASKPVNLHCLGKVTRLDSPASDWSDQGLPFEVAATLERYEFVRNQLS
ncbi:MAG: PilZ domain-containing protein [Bryobacteraceae bacterium]